MPAGRNLSLAATEKPDTLAAAVSLGSAPDDFSLGTTEAADSFAANVGVLVTFQLAATEAPDTFAAIISDPISAALAAAESPDVLAAAVSTSSGISLGLAATEAPDVLAIGANAAWDVALSATESPDVLASSLSAAITSRNLALQATEAPDTTQFILSWENGSMFDPNTDTAYAKIQSDLSKLSGPDREEYIQNLIEYFCYMHTSSASLSPAAVSTTASVIDASRRQHKRTF